MLNFYDFEVFKQDWLVVIINPQEQTTVTIINDADELKRYYRAHKRQIWVGYNSRHYDQYILKAIICGFNPKDVNDHIIKHNRAGWEFSSLFKTIPLYDYDCMSKFFGLKQLEAYMGNDIRETSVPFDIDRKLTPVELAESAEYCKHDVEQTMQVFIRTKETYEAHLAMLKTFGLTIDNISKTQAQLSALALGCERHDWHDEWQYSILDCLDIHKYASVVSWFEAQRSVRDYSSKLEVDVCGVPHVFGWGGLHGAPDKPLHLKGCILHVDVTSFYPSIMIEHDMLSRNVKDKSVYKRVYDKRVALKKAGKKKEQAPYKIILNSTYGICKDKYSAAYDPRRANEVCVNGQLLLLDLLEHLEGHCELIQSNTDGLIIRIADTQEAFDTVDDICWSWEKRTGMRLGFDYVDEIYQKDVNNYLFKYSGNSGIERKGAYVKALNDLDNDLPIVNKALVSYMVDGVPVEQTINECNELVQFQKVVKVSHKYAYGMHNGKRLTDKTFRVFASNNLSDGSICKVKTEGAKPEKFANTPTHCFIDNGDMQGKTAPTRLDKSWYIELAKTRLGQFGVRDDVPTL